MVTQWLDKDFADYPVGNVVALRLPQQAGLM